ncbi:glutathione S-transferase family protein [Desertifilum sp. FACHB-1129]|uniref:Glutathione S-transferase n=1 Tax=Desertifilum tharense IPPAS B-1220 TaxID=1781255 RepID=A0A1E5QDY2_9CYAN|nr:MULTISPECIES: glutathione S-transferase family protein [Desertifilum]MDA0209084.1 glutathione S-transferase family protein [Cyanobacteria bacterium FC1]MBD2310567.1 glutathione S-transferase family protein [Desertifilum sp. FACHB-1129]MBD2322019.1 glutathione S-transferase family protein [Desertifilum sp. FACHB-866]MBD2332146.1 glutathione S-transferase family protein [Desertifilum sp. FACHB-868]OEJ72869.1 glutathione S-transferase [Desertifilum tharense IPPAS B-1220]
MSNLALIIGSKNYSSWSLRPWLALKQAGVEFQEICIPLDTPTTHTEILHYSPTGKVPVLQDGDLTIWESLAICEYIAERYAPQLWPQDTPSRAVARAVSCEMHSGFAELRRNMPMNCCARLPGTGRTLKVQANIERISNLWRNCRQTYGQEGVFLFGSFSIADAMFAPVISRFVTYDVVLDDCCQEYIRTLWSLPAMQEWLYEAQAECKTPKSL